MRRLSILQSCELSESAKQFWENKKFLAQNMMIIMNCIITFLGVFVSYLKEKENDEYERALIKMENIGICCGVIILTSIWSMLIRKFKCRCSTWLPLDSDFRFLCLEKTTLLLLRQMVVSETPSHNLWSLVFTILSMFSLFSIATITWAFDHRFIDTMISRGVRHAKLIYLSYGCSYLASNLSASIIVVCNLVKMHNDSRVQRVLFPFVFLFFTKLYSNEFARYKDHLQSEEKKHIINHSDDVPAQTPSASFNPQNPRHCNNWVPIQCIVVQMSSLLLVCWIVAPLTDVNSVFQWDPDLFTITQLLLTIIVFINGLITLYALLHPFVDATSKAQLKRPLLSEMFEL